MKVLITRNADTSNFGGAETFVFELCRQLATNDIDVVVGSALPRLHAKLGDIGTPVIVSPWLRWQKWHGKYTPLVFLLHGPWIVRLVIWYLLAIRSQKPDLIHSMNRDDHIAATIAGKLTDTPVIWTDHADLKHELNNLQVFGKNILGKVVAFWARYAQAITVVSKAEYQDIYEKTNGTFREKLKMVYNGTTAATVKPAKKPKNTIVIAITARLRHQKGLRELIDAFQQATPPTGKQLELWLIGDGPDEVELKQRAADNPNIIFKGFRDDWLAQVAACDIFAFPSYTEGFSLSLLEAAMLKRPIIASTVGGNPEVIINQKTGILIEPKQVESLRSGLQKLIDEPAYAQKLGQNAYTHWQENFDFEDIVKNEFIPLYRQATQTK